MQMTFKYICMFISISNSKIVLFFHTVTCIFLNRKVDWMIQNWKYSILFIESIQSSTNLYQGREFVNKHDRDKDWMLGKKLTRFRKQILKKITSEKIVEGKGGPICHSIMVWKSEGKNLSQTASDLKMEETKESLRTSRGDVKERMFTMQHSCLLPS